VLIFDLIHTPANLTSNSLHIETGLKAMEKLTAKQSTINFIVGIRTIFDQALQQGQRSMADNEDFSRVEQ
jgi:Tfp pilus assembly PilM family ATPase